MSDLLINFLNPALILKIIINRPSFKKNFNSNEYNAFFYHISTSLTNYASPLVRKPIRAIRFSDKSDLRCRLRCRIIIRSRILLKVELLFDLELLIEVELLLEVESIFDLELLLEVKLLL